MASVLRTQNRDSARTDYPKAVKYLRISGAEYDSEYKVRIVFNDGTQHVIDFGPFLFSYPHPQYNKYRDIELFKTFSIDSGNIVWGENWDLIFPIEELYKGQVG